MKQLAFAAAFILVLSSLVLSGTPVLRCPDANQPLAGRWKWARTEAAREAAGSAYWVGWSIERQMPENEIIGSFYAEGAPRPTLKGILYGEAEPQLSVHEEARKALDKTRASENHRARIVTRELGILIQVSPQGEVKSSEVSLLNLSFNTRGLPIAWLGKAGQQESLTLVTALYGQGNTAHFKEELISAAASHTIPEQVIPFLQKIFMEENSDDLRGEAAFWLANQNDPASLKVLLNQLVNERSREVIDQAMAGLQSTESSEAVDVFAQLASHGNPRVLREQAIFWLGQTESEKAAALLKSIITGDPDTGMRKKAVFSLSQMPEEMALAPLIELARGNAPDSVRKEAVFGLSQIASKRVAGVLKDTVESDPSFEVQKQALFALSELEDQAGVEELIHIANTHPNREIRKEAIFWLGECDDPRAREALLKMLQ